MKAVKEELVSFKVHKSVHKEVKVHCAEMGISITGFYEQAAIAKLHDSLIYVARKKKAK